MTTAAVIVFIAIMTSVAVMIIAAVAIVRAARLSRPQRSADYWRDLARGCEVEWSVTHHQRVS